MAETIKKIYLPNWYKKVIIPLLVIVWVGGTYDTFFNPAAMTDQMATGEYVLFSIVLLGASGLTYLMADGKLPAYIQKEAVEEE